MIAKGQVFVLWPLANSQLAFLLLASSLSLSFSFSLYFSLVRSLVNLLLASAGRLVSALFGLTSEANDQIKSKRLASARFS